MFQVRIDFQYFVEAAVMIPFITCNLVRADGGPVVAEPTKGQSPPQVTCELPLS